MLDSKKTLADIRKDLDTQFNKARDEYQTRVNFLSALPSGTPAPAGVNIRGYCAEMNLLFEGGTPELFKTLLQLYPPEPAVYLYGDSVTTKPVCRIRESEQRWARIDVYPVIPLATDMGGKTPRHTMRWWTLVGPTLTEIAMVHDGKQPMVQDPGIAPCGFGTCLGRAVAEPVARPCSLALWETAWGVFCDAQELFEGQRQFVRALRSELVRFPAKVWTDADFPQAVYWPPEGGRMLAIPEGAHPAELIALLQQKQSERKPHAWDRIGNFRKRFSAAQCNTLLEFAAVQQRAYAQAVAATQKELNEIEAFFTLFFETHGSPNPWLRGETITRLHRLARATTGRDFELKWLKGAGPMGEFEGHRDKISIRASFLQNKVFRDFEVPSVKGESLLPQDLLVDYSSDR